jgi:AcrR family transcriptional regulator
MSLIKKGKSRPPATRDPERTKQNIIDVATIEFAEFGLSGARVDRIAEKTHTSKRMLYYYFQDKEGLYRAVLLSYYQKLRDAESGLDLRHQPPMTALQTLVEFTFDRHLQNAGLARIIMVENIHKGRNVAKMPRIAPVNSSIIDRVEDICRRGAAEGSMRADLDGFDLYSTIAALCFFNVSNRHTFRAIFQRDMGDKQEIIRRRASIWDVVRRAVAP